jgi:tRNA modification GTPase
MRIYNEDTIAAIASGVTNSGISVIRVSGPDAISIVSRIFKGRIPLTEAESHTIHYGFICDGEKTIDEVLVLVMRAPKTYTREDVVEIDCHGGVLITRKVLETVLGAGARHAEPGEFTKRAFLNGRIDLSQAEAVMDIIGSTGNAALKQSVKQLRGSIKTEIERLRGIILDDVAYIEAALDDPEHISVDEYRETLEQHINSVTDDVSGLISSFDSGRIIKEGIDTVILGRPNVGKSTLLNNFAGEERAIVTDIAGTTRDLLEIPVSFGGIVLNITDTAGLRETDDPVEKIGVERARKKSENADLILYLIDGTGELSGQEIESVRSYVDKNLIVLINKNDVEGSISAADFARETGIDAIEISAKNKTGMNMLCERIKEMFFKGNILENEPVFVTNERHKNLLCESLESLKAAKNSLDSGMSEDFITIDLNAAYDTLGLIIGETPDEDLVNRIFEKFCMGK